MTDSVVWLQDETSLKLAANDFRSTIFRELIATVPYGMCLRMTRCQQTGQAQNVAICTYS